MTLSLPPTVPLDTNTARRSTERLDSILRMWCLEDQITDGMCQCSEDSSSQSIQWSVNTTSPVLAELLASPLLHLFKRATTTTIHYWIGTILEHLKTEKKMLQNRLNQTELSVQEVTLSLPQSAIASNAQALGSGIRQS